MNRKDHVLLGAALAVSATENWLDEHVDPETGYVLDNTLAVEGAAADSKAVGDALDPKVDTADIDDTLATSGAPADAKAVGDALDLKVAFTDIDDTLAETGKPADAKATGDNFAEIKGAVKLLDEFSGETPEAKLYDALITQAFKGTIIAGSITVTQAIELPRTALRDVRIANAIITLSDDMFTAASGVEYAYLPSFVNCRFIGNGHALWGGDYVVGGHFIGCSFVDCAIITDADNDTKTLQSAYLSGCTVLNTTVPLIKAKRLYDCHLSNLSCEAQAQPIVDTYGSDFATGGTQQLWVSNSLFEGFSAPVLKLSGGMIRIRDCYFEANSAGCVTVAKSEDALNLLFLEIAGCKVTAPEGTEVSPFAIDGYTKDFKVNISIHNNNYNTNAEVAMVSGVVSDDLFSVYDNAKSSADDVICSDSLPIYDPTKTTLLTVNTTYFTSYSGGWVQFGSLVFVDAIIKAKANISSSLSNAITGLPQLKASPLKIHLIESGEEIDTILEITGSPSHGNIVGAITADKYYRVHCWYLTSNTASA